MHQNRHSTSHSNQSIAQPCPHVLALLDKPQSAALQHQRCTTMAPRSAEAMSCLQLMSLATAMCTLTS